MLRQGSPFRVFAINARNTGPFTEPDLGVSNSHWRQSLDAFSNTVKNAKILIVDDSPTQLLLIKETLASDGFTNIYETTDPRQVDYLHRTHQFDLILLDLNMPYMSGFDVIEQLKTIQSIDEGLSIIAVSGQDEDTTKKRALESGVLDFITKPFQIEELRSRIHTHIDAMIASV